MTIEQACPCFFTLPVAYHGRGSSVVISGTPFHRPKGQFPAVDGSIISGPCQRLDFEVEFAAFIGKGNDMGNEISVEDAEDHIFGFVLMNDWSARDIQMYETALMGPFNGKNFCTTISPWIVPLEALQPFRVAPQKTPVCCLDGHALFVRGADFRYSASCLNTCINGLMSRHTVSQFRRRSKVRHCS